MAMNSLRFVGNFIFAIDISTRLSIGFTDFTEKTRKIGEYQCDLWWVLDTEAIHEK